MLNLNEIKKNKGMKVTSLLIVICSLFILNKVLNVNENKEKVTLEKSKINKVNKQLLDVKLASKSSTVDKVKQQVENQVVEANKDLVNYQKRLNEDIEALLINPKKIEEWKQGKSSFHTLFASILNDTEKLEESLLTNLRKLRVSLELKEFEEKEIEDKYRVFYYRAMELYQKSFDGTSADYLEMISISNEYYRLEDELILEQLGRKKLKIFREKELKRRANFYALLRFYSK